VERPAARRTQAVIVRELGLARSSALCAAAGEGAASADDDSDMPIAGAASPGRIFPLIDEVLLFEK
jgi:hypothetical protein